jgi:hypothetical protein
MRLLINHIHQSRELDSMGYQIGCTMNPEGALRALNKPIQNPESHIHSLIHLYRAYKDVFQIAIMTRKSFPLGMEYVKKS